MMSSLLKIRLTSITFSLLKLEVNLHVSNGYIYQMIKAINKPRTVAITCS